MAMEIKRVQTKALGLDGWVEVGGRVRLDGKVCKVTKIEAVEGGHKVTMVEAGVTTYDALGLERPLFAPNAIAVQGAAYEVVLTDVTAVQSEEVADEEPAEDEE